jgi:hypothetical protein
MASFRLTYLIDEVNLVPHEGREYQRLTTLKMKGSRNGRSATYDKHQPKSGNDVGVNECVDGVVVKHCY